MSDRDLRAVFAVGPAAGGDTVFIVGLPRKAVEKMIAEPGWALPIDLSHAGVPMVLSIFSAEDQEACKAQIREVAKTLDIPVSGSADREFPVKDRRS